MFHYNETIWKYVTESSSAHAPSLRSPQAMPSSTPDALASLRPSQDPSSENRVDFATIWSGERRGSTGGACAAEHARPIGYGAATKSAAGPGPSSARRNA